MTTAEAIDWIWNNAPRKYPGIKTRDRNRLSDLTTYLDELRDELNSEGKSGNQMRGFMRSVGTDAIVSDVLPEIDQNNKRWLTDIKTAISRAESIDDLDSIERNIIDAEGGRYETQSVDSARQALTDARATVKVGVAADVFNDLKKQVERATTFDQLQRLDEERLAKLESGSKERKELNRVISDRFDELGVSLDTKVLGELSDKIASASSIDQLQRVNPNEGITSQSRRELAKQYNQKMKELSKEEGE